MGGIFSPQWAVCNCLLAENWGPGTGLLREKDLSLRLPADVLNIHGREGLFEVTVVGRREGRLVRGDSSVEKGGQSCSR